MTDTPSPEQTRSQRLRQRRRDFYLTFFWCTVIGSVMFAVILIVLLHWPPVTGYIEIRTNQPTPTVSYVKHRPGGLADDCELKKPDTVVCSPSPSR